MAEGETLTTAELRKLYDEMDEKAHQGHDFENWKAIYCGRYAVTELKPDIAIVIEGGCISAIATAGQGMTIRVIDLDMKNVGEPSAINDCAPDVENVDIEQYTKDMMED